MFWVDVKPQTACCRFATDEELETDPEQYDCATCPVRDALDGLYPENRQAWNLYSTVMTRFAHETQTTGWLLERVTRDLHPDDIVDLADRLAVVFDELNPIRVVTPDGP